MCTFNVFVYNSCVHNTGQGVVTLYGECKLYRLKESAFLGLHWLSRVLRALWWEALVHTPLGLLACQAVVFQHASCVFAFVCVQIYLPRNLILLPSLHFQNIVCMFISLDFPNNGDKNVCLFSQLRNFTEFNY